MHITILLPFILFLLTSLHIPSTQTACCRPDIGGDCGDNSNGTPCCGYKKCNGFCCKCEGVQLIRQEIEQISDGKPFTTISVITAKSDTTWTCRQDHITKFPPAIRDVESVTATAVDPAKPVITAPPIFRVRPEHPGYDGPAQEAEECDDILMEISGGTGKVTLEQYLQYFNVTDEHSRRGNAIVNMFYERDQDGDGVLTKEEIEQML